MTPFEQNPETIQNSQRAGRPKLAMCNIFSDIDKLRKFAFDHGFSGIDWSFDVRTLPDTPAEESMWATRLSKLEPLEIRYHCPFYRIDIGYDDPREARMAEAVFHLIIHLVSKTGGKYLTIHIGLGHDTTEPLSWEASIDNLARLVQYGGEHGVKVCLENLAWGWTSRPDLFEKLVRRTGAAVTFDMGHAHACESVQSHDYAIEDFVTPHAERVFNAHIYHTELDGQGHIPPNCVEDIVKRLALLRSIGCEWWVLELKETDALLQTKQVIHEYLTQTS